MPRSRPHQPVKKGPGEDEPGQAVRQAAGPELVLAAEVPARVERRLPRGQGGGRDAEGVEEHRGQEGEDEVEDEARVGLEAEDAGGDAEERGGERLQVREDLGIRWQAGRVLAGKFRF